LPCCHSLGAMKFLNLDEEEFIPLCFKMSTYEETYQPIIYPTNGQHQWDVTEYPDVLPPPKRILPGRPKKKRRLEAWEMKKKDKHVISVKRSGVRRRKINMKLNHPNQSTKISFLIQHVVDLFQGKICSIGVELFGNHDCRISFNNAAAPFVMTLPIF